MSLTTLTKLPSRQNRDKVSRLVMEDTLHRNLEGVELQSLFTRVFSPEPKERNLAVLIDLPDFEVPDEETWHKRRQIAAQWVVAMNAVPNGQFKAKLYGYRNPRRNNADLPDTAWLLDPNNLPSDADKLDPNEAVEFDEILSNTPFVVAPTEFSATAPLKLAARRLSFRGVTMPGFSLDMLQALKLDYTEINRRVRLLCDLLDDATQAELDFLVDGTESYKLVLDLRHRKAHASGGLFPENGQVGNLPSGEAYIVPYEGEAGPSKSEGSLPVQLGDEVVVYPISNNRATSVQGDGPVADHERKLLAAEPAYGNLAELGLGVLADFGIKPIGEVLLDEKLGLHIAFGRSDHFGGQVGAKDFSKPEAVVHIDRVYVEEMQPRVIVRQMDLAMNDETKITLISDGVYAIDF